MGTKGKMAPEHTMNFLLSKMEKYTQRGPMPGAASEGHVLLSMGTNSNGNMEVILRSFQIVHFYSFFVVTVSPRILTAAALFTLYLLDCIKFL